MLRKINTWGNAVLMKDIAFASLLLLIVISCLMVVDTIYMNRNTSYRESIFPKALTISVTYIALFLYSFSLISFVVLRKVKKPYDRFAVFILGIFGVIIGLIFFIMIIFSGFGEGQFLG